MRVMQIVLLGGCVLSLLVFGSACVLAASVGESVTFRATIPEEFNQDEVVVWWDMGDATQYEGTAIQHAYAEPGEYTIVSLVTDGDESIVRDYYIRIEAQTLAQPIYINELLPNPVGPDSLEWIELYNPNTTAVSLAGWVLRDAGGKEFVFPNDATIDIQEKVVLHRDETKIALNNSNETVMLLNPAGGIVHETSYIEYASEGVAWVRHESGAWQWSTVPTPGEQNKYDATPDAPEVVEQHTEASTAVQETDTAIVPLPTPREINQVYITELLPNPAGDERLYEYIELFNPNEHEVVLRGWRITDGKREYYFADEVIAPRAYLLLERATTKIALNNTGDEVLLIDQAERLIDSVSFSKAPSGQARVNIDDVWMWVPELTPGEENDIVIESAYVEGNDTDITPDFLVIASLADMQGVDKGDQVVVQGVVTALPGQFNDQILYIADSTGGVQVFMFSKSWPALALGDVVEISGEVSSYYGETRIKVASSDAIIVLAHDADYKPVDIAISELDNHHVGQLVRVHGEVLDKKGNSIELASINDFISVLVKSRDNLILSDIRVGDILEAIGVVRSRDGTLFVHIRDEHDFVTTTVAGFATGYAETSTIVQNQNAERNIFTIALYGFAGFVGGVLCTLLYQHKKY